MEGDSILLLGALENILGKGHKRARGNYAFHCPFCSHAKLKLEISLETNEKGENPWQCWVCGEKGRTIRSLLRHLHLSVEECREVLQFVQKGTVKEDYSKYNKPVKLPEEFQLLYTADIDSFEANRYRQYLYKRGLTDDDFIKYSIGYCSKGKYRDRVIVPSFNENNQLNYFTARSVDPDAFLKYINPDVHRDSIICFENLVNWNEAIILCEGMFDSISLARNSVPLLGKQISSALMKKIIQSPLHSVYLMLDDDAKAASLKHCETFLNLGKKVYFVELPGKDASELGRAKSIQTLQKVKELTFTDLIRYKLEL